MQWRALVLDCRIHRRRLRDRAPELDQRCLDLGTVHIASFLRHHLSFGIVGVGGDSQPHAGAVDFFAIVMANTVKELGIIATEMERDGLPEARKFHAVAVLQ